jgi:hypothetical protein
MKSDSHMKGLSRKMPGTLEPIQGNGAFEEFPLLPFLGYWWNWGIRGGSNTEEL